MKSQNKIINKYNKDKKLKKPEVILPKLKKSLKNNNNINKENYSKQNQTLNNNKSNANLNDENITNLINCNIDNNFKENPNNNNNNNNSKLKSNNINIKHNKDPAYDSNNNKCNYFNQKTSIDNYNQSISKATDFINSVIHEYLLKKEYIKTLTVFQNEVEEKINSKIYYLSSFSKDYNEKTILHSFETGNKQSFFNIFNCLFPAHVRKREESIKQLEFKLQVYFTVYPILTNKDKSKKQKNFINTNTQKVYNEMLKDFKLYLDSNQRHFKSDSSLICYFALPYIENPIIDDTYNHLFNSKYSEDIKEQLIKSIKRFIPLGRSPLLYEVFNIYNQTIDNSKNIIINQISNLNTQDYNTDKNIVIENLKKEINEYKKYNYVENKDNNNNNNKEYLIESQLKWNKLCIDVNSIAGELFNILDNIKTCLNEYNKANIESNKDNIIRLLNNKISNINFESKQLCLNKYDTFFKSNMVKLKSALNKSNNQENIHNNNNKDNISHKEQTNLFKDNINYSYNVCNNEPDISGSNLYNYKLTDQLDNSIINEENNTIKIYNCNHEYNNKTIDNNNYDINKSNLNNTNTNNNTLVNQYSIINNTLKEVSKFNKFEKFDDLIINNIYLNLIDIEELKKAICKLKLNNESIINNQLNSIYYIIKELRLRILNKSKLSNNIDYKKYPLNYYTLYSIIHYDLLGFKNKYSDILNKLFEFDSRINNETIKLINTLASVKTSRDYLLTRNNIIPLMLKYFDINTKKKNIKLINNIIGILQKLSLDTNTYDIFYDSNALNTIISFLYVEQGLYNKSNRVVIADYTVEYSLALLLNLTLKKRGIELVEELASPLLKVLMHYINIEDINVRTCINGIMYNIFKNLSIRKKAINETNILYTFENIIKDNKDELINQYIHIVKILKEENEIIDNQNELSNSNDYNYEKEEEIIDDKCNIDDSLLDEYFSNSNNHAQDYYLNYIKAISNFIIKSDKDNFKEIKTLNNEFDCKHNKYTSFIKETNSKQNQVINRPITPLYNINTKEDNILNNNDTNNYNCNNIDTKLDITNNNCINYKQEINCDKTNMQKKQNINNSSGIEDNSKPISKTISSKDKEAICSDKSLTNNIDIHNKSKVNNNGYTYDFDKEDINADESVRKAFKTKTIINRTPNQTFNN